MINSRKRRILLIDDDSEFCRHARIAFENVYEMTIVRKVERVLAELENDQFDLVLLDLFLGNDSYPIGFSLVKEIKRYDARVPIIAITNDDSQEITYQALKIHKIEDILLKPNLSFEKWKETFDRTISDHPTRSVFISYAEKDKPFVEFLTREFDKEGFISVINGNNNRRHIGYQDISSSILDCNFFIPILTESSTKMNELFNELTFAKREKQGKAILPIKVGDFTLSPRFKLQLEGLTKIQFEDWKHFEELKSQYTYEDWLPSSTDDPFERLKNSYLGKVGEIVDFIFK